VSAYTPIQKQATSTSLTIVTTAYTAGDQAGAQNTVSAIGAASGQVLVNDISLADASARIAAHELRFFSASVTGAGDNNAVSFSDADNAKRQGPVIYASSIITDSLNSSVDYAFKPFVATCDASGNLYFYCILRAVPVSNFFSAVGDLIWTIGAFRIS